VYFACVLAHAHTKAPVSDLPEAALLHMPRVLQIDENDDQEHEVNDYVCNGNLPAVTILLFGQGVELQASDDSGLVHCKLRA